jgi:hypothetical protein
MERAGSTIRPFVIDSPDGAQRNPGKLQPPERSPPDFASLHPGYDRFLFFVIASEAKQSIGPQAEKWIASSLRSSQ